MILRRFMQHINEQNWFAVGLDVIVVVVGIFLGLQVTAWNDVRLERADERGYLARLHQDFSQSITNNQIRLDRVYTMWKNTKIVSDSLASCELADEDKDSFASGIFGFGKYIPLALSGTAIDELKSTGKFQIIKSEEIRNLISQNITTTNNQIMIGGSVYQAILPHLHLIEKQYAHKVMDADPSFPFPPLTWDSMLLDFETLCQNQEIQNSISQIYRYMRGYSIRAFEALEEQKVIMAMLEAELGTN